MTTTTITQQRAKEIMGKNFFGPQDALRFFEVVPTPEQDTALAEVPFSEEVLTAYKDTHILVAVFPISLLELRDCLVRQLHFRKPFYPHENAWHNTQAFMRERGEAGWHLVRKTRVENSAEMTWKEQQELLSPKEETPAARVLTYTIFGHFLATGERLFQGSMVRCSDVVGSSGYRARIGAFDDTKGLYVGEGWDDNRYIHVSVASARKPYAGL